MLCLLLFILPFSFLRTQNGEASYERKISRDAARITLREMMGTKDNRLKNVSIPTNIWSEYYQVLLAVYESPQQGHLGKKLEDCNIHTSPELAIDHAILIVYKNADWVRPLRNGGKLTRIERINTVFEKYGIQPSLVDWDDEHEAVVLNSEQPLNISALITLIQQEVDGVQISRSELRNAGNDIQISKNKEGWEVTYYYRFGGQFGNNKKEHFWKYQCSKNHQVEFIQEGGDELPSWVPCRF